MSADAPPPSDAALDLAAIRARWAAATGGEWFLDWDGRYGKRIVSPIGPDCYQTVAECSGYTSENTAADAAFLVAAHTDIPALLAEVERLRALLPRGEGA